MRLTKNSYIKNACVFTVSFKGRGQSIDRTIVDVAAFRQGLYIIFQMDWKRARRPITKYTFPFLQSSLRVKNIASGKKLQRLLGNTNGGRPDNGVSVCEGVYSRP